MKKKIIIGLIIFVVGCLVYGGYVYTVLTNSKSKHQQQELYNPPQESEPQSTSQESEAQDSEDSDVDESQPPSGWKIQFDTVHEVYRWCDDTNFCPGSTFESKEETIADAWSFYHSQEEKEKSEWIDVED
jgi:hypothetical protein